MAKVCRYSSVWSTQKRRYCAITRRSISDAAIVPALTSASISSVPAGMNPASTRRIDEPLGSLSGLASRSAGKRKSTAPSKSTRRRSSVCIAHVPLWPRQSLGQTALDSQPRNDAPGWQHDVVFHVDGLQDALDRETVDWVEY